MVHCRARRDPNFEAKARNALLLHEQLSFREDEALPGRRPGPPRVRVRARARLPDGLVEGLLSRTARRTLRGIRVLSKDEPEERILRHHGEADVEPVICRRRWSLSDMDPTTEGLVVDTLLSDGADKAR